MALSECGTRVAENGREMVEHGTVAFPIACYHDDLAKQIVPWHWHEEWELAIITEGTAVVAVDSERLVLEAGSGFFINTEVLHGAWNFDASACRFHSLVFHPRLVGGSIDSAIWQNYVQPLWENINLKYLIFQSDVEWHREAIDYIENAWRACVHESAGHELIVRNALSQLIFLIVGHEKGVASKPSARSMRDGSRMKAMLQYIHNHFGEEITIDNIAASAAISKSECLRCFHNTIGTTPIQYLKNYRIERAAELLTDTEDKVVDIGIQCGFQDMSYFARAFRKVKGYTPTEWREKND